MSEARHDGMGSSVQLCPTLWIPSSTTPGSCWSLSIHRKATVALLLHPTDSNDILPAIVLLIITAIFKDPAFFGYRYYFLQWACPSWFWCLACLSSIPWSFIWGCQLSAAHISFSFLDQLLSTQAYLTVHSFASLLRLFLFYTRALNSWAKPWLLMHPWSVCAAVEYRVEGGF